MENCSSIYPHKIARNHLYFVLNRVDKDSKEAMLKSIDTDRVAAFVPEDKRIFMAGLSGEDIDLHIDEIEQLANFLEENA